MLSDYEKRALAQIHEWKTPRHTWLNTAIDYMNKPMILAGDALEKIPGFTYTCTKASNGLLNLVNDGAQWSVRPEAILAELSRVSQRDITRLDQVWQLDLEQVDKSIGWLDTKYKGLAMAEGAAAGGTAMINPVVAMAAIPADLVALLGINLRAIGEYAGYCGFDMTSQEERLYTLNVLAYASSSTDKGKQAALAHMVKIAQDVVRNKTWEHLNQSAFVQIVRSITEALGYKLTKAKLANTIPFAGAAISSGFNGYFTSRVCNTAFYMYRERLLIAKHGQAAVDANMAPAHSHVWSKQDREAD